MKVYTFYTESHKKFLDDYFLPSFESVGEYDLQLKEFEQECASGEFMQEGWNRTMRRKVEYIIQACEETMGGYFIHADIDIQFLRPSKGLLLREMMGYEMAFQNDLNMMCAGFFACKSSEKTLSFFNKVLEDLHNHANDQIAINHYLRQGDISYKVLPDQFYTVAMSLDGREWNGEESFEVPDDIVIHHANYTRGIDRKFQLLDLVKQKTGL